MNRNGWILSTGISGRFAPEYSDLLCCGNDSHFIEVIKDGNVLKKGFTKCFSLADEEKELILFTPETWKDYPDIEMKFSRINNTFINIEKGIMINDYDLSEYKTFCESLSKK